MFNSFHKFLILFKMVAITIVINNKSNCQHVLFKNIYIEFLDVFYLNKHGYKDNNHRPRTDQSL